MHARVTTHNVHTGRMEERLQHAVERSVPLVRQKKGFRGIMFLVDHAAHRNLTISLWESEEEEWATARDQEFLNQLSHKHFASGDVVRETFQVALDHSGTGPATHARVTTYHLHPGRMEERLRHAEEQTCPVLHAQPGYRGHLILVDRTTHKNVVITLWDGAEAREGSLTAPALQQVRSRHHFGAGHGQTENFDIGHAV